MHHTRMLKTEGTKNTSINSINSMNRKASIRAEQLDKRKRTMVAEREHIIQQVNRIRATHRRT
ncbi:hypothetical protein C8J55DRAFT_6277 [Lentinula edodes]|uniref:Uncharacterized protein n=1 Tax=Lentinula lateritia TaxID=40482 RepID=A0A9W9E0V0_9AGAR|nr:hypothetical protein C8J55DRAFT_6277 [Lentinula edodes]